MVDHTRIFRPRDFFYFEGLKVFAETRDIPELGHKGTHSAGRPSWQYNGVGKIQSLFNPQGEKTEAGTLGPSKRKAALSVEELAALPKFKPRKKRGALAKPGPFTGGGVLNTEGPADQDGPSRGMSSGKKWGSRHKP